MQTKQNLLDWDRADIGAALKKSGTNLRQLSLNHGYSRNAASNACSKPYPKLEAIIAAALGLTVEDIWPSRCEQRKQRNSRNLSTHCVQVHSDKADK
jgi:Ner family transcriptional regulator